MNCQNCRTPLRLDNSLQNLDLATFQLLIGSAGHSVDPSIAPIRLPYASDRKALYDDAQEDAVSPVFKRIIPAARQGFGAERAMAASAKAGRNDDPTMSFAVLTESEVLPARQAVDTNGGVNANQMAKQSDHAAQHHAKDSTQALSQQIESSTRLFEILSSRSDIDHPICTECTELLLTSLKSRLDATTKERDAYIMFLKTLNNSAPNPSEVAKAQASLAKSRAAESKAFAELQALENEKTSLEEEITDLEAESLALDDEEELFWRSRNAFALELSSSQSETEALKAACDNDTRRLEQLQRTKVYNDAFFITSIELFDFTFAQINGLRLGRLPPKVPVDWAEINAAWGYAVLLLATVADKLGFVFRGYTLIPMGSMSRIDQEQTMPQNSNSTRTQSASTQSSKPKVISLDLFSSGDIPLMNAMVHRKINTGMVAFLECLRQLSEFVERGRAETQASATPASKATKDMPVVGLGYKMPYSIKGDKIGGGKKGFKLANIH